MHPTHPVPHIHAVVTTCASHRAVPRRKNNRLALIGPYYLGFGLRPRLLLDQQELPAFPVAPLLPQQEYHLQGKADVAVDVLVQAVVSARVVVEQQRRRLGLSGLVANFQKGIMFSRESRAAENFSPLIRNIREMRISMRP